MLEHKEPGNPETRHEGLPSVEETFGREGSVIALTFALSAERKNASIWDILIPLSSGGDFPNAIETIQILTKAGFKRVSLTEDADGKREPIEDEEGNYWMRPPGKEDDSTWDFVDRDGNTNTVDVARIQAIFKYHKSENPGIDFGFDEPPTASELENAKPYPEGYDNEPDPWDRDDPTTEQ